MVELLAPAGNVEALDAAIGEGADAVYLGLKSFNARLRSSNFAWNQFEGAVQSLHRLGKKIYVTVNTVCEEGETERLYRFLSYLNKVGPDGLIVQDFGVIRMCQEFFPDLELHASTQMNVASSAGVNLLSKEGLKRVVVARELGLSEIKDIKAKSSAELEVFVHGALCVSESGLCLFSSFLGGKSANRGMCTQACRRFYTADVGGGAEEQGYYFSPSDLQLIDKIPDLVEAGVASFKIEGRMKSAEYVGSVVAAYRYLLDHYKEDKKGSIAAAKRMLATDFARSKTTYWYGFKTEAEGISNAGSAILNPNQAGGTGIYLGKIERTAGRSDDGGRFAHLVGGSYDPDEGDSIRLHKKDDTGRVSHKIKTVSIDEKGSRWIDIPDGFSKGDEVYLLQTKSMSKRYKRVLPNDIGKFRSQPGAERLPILDLTAVEKNELSYFPQGLYIQVSTVSDLFVVQSQNPVRIILEWNFETKNEILEKKTTLPLSKKQILISLDPFCPQDRETELSKELDELLEMGFCNFVVNNISHISLLKGKKAVDAKSKINLVAGPYLYTFNRWAASWLENQNIGSFITPIENSKKNLYETFDKDVRERAMVTVFSYPALFRLRFRLPESYDFSYFSDKEGMEFKIASNIDGSIVMPEAPFSIVDKAEELKKDGFTRILIDFSRTKVTKGDVKKIVGALTKKAVIPEASRFNWKDGFYNPEKMEAYAAANERRREEMRQNKGKYNKRKKSHGFVRP